MKQPPPCIAKQGLREAPSLWLVGVGFAGVQGAQPPPRPQRGTGLNERSERGNCAHAGWPCFGRAHTRARENSDSIVVSTEMERFMSTQRRRKSDAERRETLLRIRVNDAEYEHLKALAKQANMTPSALVRDHLGKVKVRNRSDEQQRVAMLNRINANLNMIARWCNVHKGAADTIEVISHLQAIQAAVEELADQQKGSKQ